MFPNFLTDFFYWRKSTWKLGTFYIHSWTEWTKFQKDFNLLLKLWKKNNLFFPFYVTAEIPLSRTRVGGDEEGERCFEKKVGFMKKITRSFGSLVAHQDNCSLVSPTHICNRYITSCYITTNKLKFVFKPISGCVWGTSCYITLSASYPGALSSYIIKVRGTARSN